MDQSWVLSPFSNCVTLGKQITSLILCFLLCKIRIMVSTRHGCYGDNIDNILLIIIIIDNILALLEHNRCLIMFLSFWKINEY